MGRLLGGLDLVDGLLVVGLVCLIGGIAALSKPWAAIVLGVILLALWVRKTWRSNKWVG